MSAIFAISYGSPKNSELQRDLNPWPRDEATDVGDWSFAGSNGTVRNEWMMKWYMNYIYLSSSTADVKSNKLWASQLWMQFLQSRVEAWKNDMHLFNWICLQVSVWVRLLKRLCCIFLKTHVWNEISSVFVIPPLSGEPSLCCFSSLCNLIIESKEINCIHVIRFSHFLKTHMILLDPMWLSKHKNT